MASAADLRSVEEACPWLEDGFQADLELLRGGTAAQARMYAADLRVIARLAAQVPRVPFDETGASPWTSFRREVAVSRKVSDREAARVIRCALRLTNVLPRALALLQTGELTARRAEAFVAELDALDDELAAKVDVELADIVTVLPVWRIEQAVRQAVHRLDPDAVAERVAVKNAARGVELHPDVDDQASVSLIGPAVPLVRWFATLTDRARALKAAGDPRTLDALKFDLATSDYPCDSHAPADSTAPAASEPADEAAGAGTGEAAPAAREAKAAQAAAAHDSAAGRAKAVDNHPGPAGETPEPAREHELAPVASAGAAGLRPSFVEPAPADCRRSRPVQARVGVPVETSLGLSNDPAWLDGYGWISATTCRLLLVDAELRQVCVKAGTGEIVDLAAQDVRPPPTPTGLRDSLLAMVLGDRELSDVGWRTEPEHDPSDRLREYVTLRDRACDGPTGARVSAKRAELDHDNSWPSGPTAAWNLAARGARTHQLKHYGWTPLRTPTGTRWISPSGQIVETPRHTNRPSGIDPDPTGMQPVLPDPDELALLDQLQLAGPEDLPPVRPPDDEDTRWMWLGRDNDPPPF